MAKYIGLVGANGLPASYGGWDQLLEQFSLIDNPDLRFIVYCTYKTNTAHGSTHNNAKIDVIHLDANGWQSVLFDIVSLYRASKVCDAIIMLGTSGAIALPIFRLFGVKVILNIDGAEWKRGKWNPLIKAFLWISEYVGVRSATLVVADNEILSHYVEKKYSKKPVTIAYGGDHAVKINPSSLLERHKLKVGEYAFKVCRIVPENNLDIILESFSKVDTKFVLVGNFSQSDYGKALQEKYQKFRNIYLLAPIYNQTVLDELRGNAGLYIHGHSVGGTNPSLVEAMSLGLNIASFDVNYNRATTDNSTHLFGNEAQLIEILKQFSNQTLTDLGPNAKAVANRKFTWDNVMSEYTLALSKLLFNKSQK